MITILILKHNKIKVPVMVYDNETMYIDESVKKILYNMRNELWTLFTETMNSRCKTLTELNSGHLEIENVKLDNDIYANYIKVKFK